MSVSIATENTVRLFSSLRRLRVFSDTSLLALSAIAAGLMVATLPLRYSVGLLGGGALLAIAFLEPLVGLAIMLLLGLTEPLLGAAGLLPFSIGQATFVLFVTGWLLRGLARRELRWPQLPITIPFFVYLAACALSVFFTQPASPRDAATELLKWIEMYVIAGITVDAAGRNKLGWVLAILFGVGLFQAGVGLWQFQFRGDGPEPFKILGDHYRAYGTLEQPNPFGGFMGIAWPLAAMLTAGTFISILKKRTATGYVVGRRFSLKAIGEILRNRQIAILAGSLMISAFTLGALVISFSRGAWLGATAASLAMLIFWPRRRWVGVTLAAGGVAALFALYNFGLLPSFIASRFADVGDFVQVYDVRGVHINDTNFSIVERLAHWQAALNMADASPLFGVGLGNYEAAYTDYRLINWQYALGHAHMIYLNVLAETGIVGLIAYLFLWVSIVWITIRVIVYKDLTGFRNLSGLQMDRLLALGLLGCWGHLSTHQLLDNLYVGNIPLYIGALLGLLCILAARKPSNIHNPISNL